MIHGDQQRSHGWERVNTSATTQQQTAQHVREWTKTEDVDFSMLGLTCQVAQLSNI